MRDLAQDALENPFPGLRPFHEEEEHLFFGRENQVDAMVGKLAATHFLTVVGTSGSGKSSLVNCGLRPALRRGLMAGAGTSWRMAQFRPGNEPIAAMVRALSEDGVLFSGHDDEVVPLPQLVGATLRMSKLGLIDIVEQAGLGENVNFLLVVDQFEELFRYRQLGIASQDDGRAAEEITAFVNLLLEVRERAPARIFVVLTMRSDFLGDCTQFPGLAEAINAGQYLVPRLTRDERRDAIEGPIQVRGAELSPVLLTQLVNDVGDNPDQLSILQHALNRTWAYWRKQGGKGPLELEHYAAIGTMAKALNQHADEALHELADDRQRQICEQMFKALTDKASDPRGVRRPTKVATLCALTDASMDEITSVVDVFREKSRSFLMPPISEKLRPDMVVDISHESLMRVWEQLNIWADDEAQSVRIYRRLADAAEEYDRGETSLYSDPQLQVALDWRNQNKPNETWAERYHPGFKGAMKFLNRSKAKSAEQKRRQERALRITQATALGMTLLAGAAVYLGVEAYRASGRAYLASKAAQESLVQAERSKGRLLVDASKHDPDDKSKSILLAIESLPDRSSSDPRVANRPPVFEAQSILSDAIRGLREIAVLSGHTKSVNGVAVLPDGNRVVTGSDDKTARVWDLENRTQLLRLDHTQPVLAVAVTPDSQRIVTASADNVARVWFAATGDLQRELIGHRGRVSALAITRDGARVVTGSDDRTARIWDLDSGEFIELKGHRGPVFGVAVTPDGEHVVTASGDRTVGIWNAKTGELLRQFTGHRQAVFGVVVTEDGSQVISRSADRSVRVWDFETVQARMQINEVDSLPVSVTVVPERLPGLLSILVGWGDGTVRKWTANSGDLVPVLRLDGHEKGVLSVAVTPDGARMISGSADGTTRIWSFAASKSFPSRSDAKEARQALVSFGKEVVPRCLTIKQRQKLGLGPRPPDWCIDMQKYPYDAEVWRDWKAGRKFSDSEIAIAYADFADKALKQGGDIKIALEAAELSVSFDTAIVWTRVNLAHAHMFMGQTDLARSEYLENCAARFKLQGVMTAWTDGVLEDFSELRANDRFDPLMDEVEARFKSDPACRAKSDQP